MSDKHDNETTQADNATNPAQNPADRDATGAPAQEGGRREFLGLTGMAMLGGATTMVGAKILGSGAGDRAQAKSKILARIQEELDSEYLNDPMTYHKGAYGEYTK